MDYTVANTADWLELYQLTETETQSPNMITNINTNTEYMLHVCHDKILHGTYDQGSFPSISMIKQDNEFYFIALHEGVHNHTVITNKCGIPIKYDGIVLDNFQINNWIKNINMNMYSN